MTDIEMTEWAKRNVARLTNVDIKCGCSHTFRLKDGDMVTTNTGDPSRFQVICPQCNGTIDFVLVTYSKLS